MPSRERTSALPPPDFTREGAWPGAVCGVDEAGRGPLAGPVLAAAVVLDPARLPAGIKDSKLLSASRRALLLEAILDSAEVGIGRASVAEIDRLNILRASLLAMRRAVLALPRQPAHALIDGNCLPDLPCQATAVVGGDRLALSIAAASIVAKVTRDRLMMALARRYPGYGFERHMGYGTKQHFEALERLGPCPIHRVSFAPVAHARARAGALAGRPAD